MTAKNLIVKLATDSRGNYRKDLGWKIDPDGQKKQQRFYLGRDRVQAQIRALKLDQLWDAVDRRSQVKPPSWDALSLLIGLSIARGDETVTVDPAQCGLTFGMVVADNTEGSPIVDGETRVAFIPDEEAKLQWFRQLQEDFGKGIKFILAGEEETCQTVDSDGQFYRRAADRKKMLARPSSEQTLHQALGAFSSWLGKKYLDITGQTSAFGKLCQRQVGNIKDHAEDIKLSSFGLSSIEDMIDQWKNRPVTKWRKPCSPEHARNVIKRIRHFVKWLHKAEAFDWRKPFDLEVTPVRIPLTQAEKSKKYSPTQVQTYSVEELGILWKYASPKERVLILLALNCGFGQMEIATLQKEEIHLNEEHGYYPLSGSFIKRARNKTHIYGEWKLWTETVTALEWYKGRRPVTNETALVVTKDGRNLADPTDGGNRNSRIANAWNQLLVRIRKDHSDFRKLSFNKLRKTAGNLVKKASDGEVMAVFMCHGQTVKTDDLADVYTDRFFDKVFEALNKVHERLAPLFAQEPNPFPADGKKHNPAISIGTRDKIIEMRKAGSKYSEIVKATGICIATVLSYSKQAGLVKVRQKK